MDWDCAVGSLRAATLFQLKKPEGYDLLIKIGYSVLY
jgi:hypothetical protein